jgi:hypothetical protein
MPSTQVMVSKTVEEVSGQDVPGYDAVLNAIGYNDALCIVLAEKLDVMVKMFRPGTHIEASQITPDLTVQNVVDITIQQIGTTGIAPGGVAD